MKQLTRDLTMLPGMVNMYLIDSPEGLTLIDAGLPGSLHKVLDALRALDRQPSDLKTIVLTHAHPDHIGSLAAVVRATKARTTMHTADCPIAETGAGFRPLSAAPGLLPTLLCTIFSRANATVEPAHIDQRMADGDVLPIAGGLEVIHVPGHCAGQVALLWRDRKVLFVGDTCTNMFGLGAPIGYEDRALGESSQRKLASLDFDVACFGHGGPILHDAANRFRKAFR